MELCPLQPQRSAVLGFQVSGQVPPFNTVLRMGPPVLGKDQGVAWLRLLELRLLHLACLLRKPGESGVVLRIRTARKDDRQ